MKMHNLNIGRKNYIPLPLVLFMLFLAIFVLPKFIMEGANTPRIYFFILALALCMIFLVSSKVAILTMVLSVFFADWLTQYIQIIPREMSWITEVILVVLLFKIILLRRGKGFQKTPIDIVVLSIIGLGVISAVINSVSPIMMLLAFRIYLRFVLLFYIIINLDLDERFLKGIVTLLIIIAFIQVPISIYQSFSWTPEVIVQKGLQGRLDYAGGTFGKGATGITAIFMLFAISLVLALNLYLKRKLIYYLLIMALLLPAVFGHGRAAFVFLPLLLLFLAFLYRGRTIEKLKLTSVLIIFLIIGVSLANFLAERYVGWSLTDFFNDLFVYLRQAGSEPSSLATFRRASSGAVRVETMKATNRLMCSNIKNFLVGFGPGSATESVFSSFMSESFYKLFDYGISAGVMYNSIVGEWGYVGFFLFLLALLQIFRFNYKFFKNINNPYWKAISFGYSGVIFLYFISIFYTRAWHADPTSFTFWFLAAAIFSVERKANIV